MRSMCICTYFRLYWNQTFKNPALALISNMDTIVLQCLDPWMLHLNKLSICDLPKQPAVWFDVLQFRKPICVNNYTFLEEFPPPYLEQFVEYLSLIGFYQKWNTSWTLKLRLACHKVPCHSEHPWMHWTSWLALVQHNFHMNSLESQWPCSL